MTTPTHLQPAQDAAMTGDLPRAIELLNQSSDPIAAADLCLNIMLHFYWKQKNIQSVITLGKAGVALALNAAEKHSSPPDAEKATTLRKHARAISYNLASFCWPGWNEPSATRWQWCMPIS